MTHSNMLGFSTFRDIQNEEQLAHYIKEHPEEDFQSGGFTMTTKMASFGVHFLNQWFSSNNHHFDIQLESETPLSDYTENNVIYIGQSKTMQASQSIFLSKSKVFKVQSDGFLYKNGDVEKHYNTLFKKNINQEYAMVSLQKLDNGNYTLFFVSNHDIGVIATIKMFTNIQKLISFYKKLPNNDVEFNALFKVSGMERTDLSCELVEIEIL